MELLKVRKTDTIEIRKASRRLAEESATWYGEQPESLIEQYAQQLTDLAINLNDIGNDYIYGFMEGHRGGWSNEEVTKNPTGVISNTVAGTTEYTYDDTPPISSDALGKKLGVPEHIADLLSSVSKN